MLRKVRITLAALFFVAVTLLFLDFTGTIHAWLGWTAKVQFVPAVLALNVAVVVLLVLLTLLYGRIYCSVICPLGVMQDVVAWFGKKAKKNRYSYSPAKTWLRLVFLGAFIGAIAAGIGVVIQLLDPYGAFGRIAANLLAPLYKWGNNGLAYIAERIDSYAFYETEVWTQSVLTLCIAIATIVIIGVLAWRNGRTYCNTVCPVGTILGYISRYAAFQPVIDTTKCIDCGRCGKNCKASCIDMKSHTIDTSRCVACMDCLESCSKHAISFTHPTGGGKKQVATEKPAECAAYNEATKSDTPDNARRTFLISSALVATAATVKAQEKKVDGGLATIEDKAVVDRQTPIIPAGAGDARRFASHCTACQLCVSACPSGVLKPSGSLSKLMQPELSYENGYCRPECTRCSDVCPTGAILPITRAEKSSIQIGHAVWVRKNCIPLTEGDACDNCQRHCPVGAIQMIDADKLPDLTDKEREALEKQTGRRARKKQVPVVNTERCIGCGACEALCPARPFTAIYVEGHERHSEV